MADTGYFESVSANLKAGVGAQVKGISEGAKVNSEAGVSPSANALDTGLKAAVALGSLADNVGGAAVLPVPGGVIRSFAYDNIGRLVDARASRFPRRVEGGFPAPPCFAGGLVQLSYNR